MDEKEALEAKKQSEDEYAAQIWQCIKRFRHDSEDSEFSQHGHLLDVVQNAAKKYALKTNPELDDLINDVEKLALAVNIISGSCNSTDPLFYEPNKTGIFWRHRPDILLDSMKSAPPNFSKTDIEYAAELYVSQDIIIPDLELLLIDILVAMELSAFAAQMAQPEKYSVDGSRESALKANHPALIFIIGRTATLLFVLIVSAVSIFFGTIISEWIPIIFIGLSIIYFLADLFISILSLPGAISMYYMRRKSTLKLLNSMNAVYLNIPSHGPVSAANLRRLLERSSDLGACWSSMIFVILDKMQNLSSVRAT
ncbi:hypothetical protein L2D00_05885 [Hyphomonadaceae bacterium BL14]|nr:hypothetical protein L2D00_05885 [Hyphomonadaceae bacterium BL14]